MTVELQYVEFISKNQDKYRFPISSFQYFDFTTQETKYKISPKENKIHETVLCNFLNALFVREPKLINNQYDTVKDLDFMGIILEEQNIDEIILYDSFHQPFKKLKLISNWDEHEKNEFQKTYLFKGCLGVNIKRNNDKY
ncbi:MAG: hypothetical protein ACRCW9_09770 [Cetobacterium sp.]